MKSLTVFLLVFLSASLTIAQPPRGNNPRGSAITGSIINTKTSQPIEYATIMLLDAADSSRVGGAVTDLDGAFRIHPVRPGSYFAQVSFIGFLSRTVDGIELSRGQQVLELGTIELNPTAVELNEVAIEGEATPVEYHLDRKVINVGQQMTAVSGSAVEVLENAPSVSVDIEGNVSLRGSGNFTVLIDGRPSVLEGSEALQQIPAGTIETIEIITNPSAKYDPGSAAGIIDVKLKRQRQYGYSGLLNVSGGTQDNRSADVLLTRKEDKLALLFGANVDERNFPGDELNESRTTLDGVTSNVITNGHDQRGRESWGVRGELDWRPTQNNSLKLGGRFGWRSFASEPDLVHQEWTSADNLRSIYNSGNFRERSGNRLSLYSTMRHDFLPGRSYLTLNSQYRFGEGEEITRNEQFASDGFLSDGVRSTEDGPGWRGEVELDYVRQFSEDSKLEAGAHSHFGESEDNTTYSEYDLTEGRYIEQLEFRNSTDYRRDIYALYSTYSNTIGAFGYQLGLRGEYTYRKVMVFDTSRDFSIDRWDYFPTTHFSYDLGSGRQLMTSYARRIDRPRGWYLEPFLTWEDAYNVREGNPDLKPEYIDSWEAGYQMPLLGMTTTIESYYRITNNRIERVQSAYDDNVTLRSIQNVGKDYSLGIEYRLTASPLKKLWEVNLTGNAYDYRVEGDLDGRSFKEQSFTWDARFNNTINITKTWRVQLDGMYHGSSVSAQGEREGFFMINAGLRKQFWDRQLTATLQARDLFATAMHKFTSSGPEFYTYREFDRDAPMISLNLSFNFNNFKPQRDRSGGMGGDDDEF